MAEKTYQQLQDDLSDVVSKLQSGDVSVDEAMELYKTGQKIIHKLEKQLQQAENEITKLTT